MSEELRTKKVDYIVMRPCIITVKNSIVKNSYSSVLGRIAVSTIKLHLKRVLLVKVVTVFNRKYQFLNYFSGVLCKINIARVSKIFRVLTIGKYWIFNGYIVC